MTQGENSVMCKKGLIRREMFFKELTLEVFYWFYKIDKNIKQYFEFYRIDMTEKMVQTRKDLSKVRTRVRENEEGRRYNIAEKMSS